MLWTLDCSQGSCCAHRCVRRAAEAAPTGSCCSGSEHPGQPQPHSTGPSQPPQPREAAPGRAVPQGTPGAEPAVAPSTTQSQHWGTRPCRSPFAEQELLQSILRCSADQSSSCLQQMNQTSYLSRFYPVLSKAATCQMRQCDSWPPQVQP